MKALADPLTLKEAYGTGLSVKVSVDSKNSEKILELIKMVRIISCQIINLLILMIQILHLSFRIFLIFH